MDVDDWDFWFRRHKQVLPAVEHWFSSMGQEGQVEVMAVWHNAMSDLTLDEALAATDAIVRGDAECRFASDTPKACRLTALAARQERRKQEFDSGVTPRFCGLCRGSGMITCWHPLVVRSVRNRSDGRYRHPVTGKQMNVRDGQGNIKGIVAASACKCTLGLRLAEKCPPASSVVPVQFRTRDEYRGLTLEEIIELDIAASPFEVQEWEYVN